MYFICVGREATLSRFKPGLEQKKVGIEGMLLLLILGIPAREESSLTIAERKRSGAARVLKKKIWVCDGRLVF